MTREQVLYNNLQKDIGTYPGVEKEKIYAAMDEWAEIKCKEKDEQISFLQKQLESIKLNTNLDNQFKELDQQVMDGYAIGFNFWLWENGYEFAEGNPNKMYLGGKYYYVTELLQLFKQSKQKQ